MNLEMWGFAGLVLVLGFLAWREMRRSSPPELTKKLRTMKKRIDSLEAQLSSVPDQQFFNEIEKKLEFSTPVKLAHVVDRVNLVSEDMTEMKRRFASAEERMKSIEFMLKMKGVVSGGGPNRDG